MTDTTLAADTLTVEPDPNAIGTDFDGETEDDFPVDDPAAGSA